MLSRCYRDVVYVEGKKENCARILTDLKNTGLSLARKSGFKLYWPNPEKFKYILMATPNRLLKDSYTVYLDGGCGRKFSVTGYLNMSVTRSAGYFHHVTYPSCECRV
jgi:hypothetical protein